MHHADLYRLERTAEVSDLALRELADFAGIVLVEWGEVVDVFGDHLVIHLQSVVDDDGDALALDGARRIEVGVVGPSWAGRWQRLIDGLEAHRC